MTALDSGSEDLDQAIERAVAAGWAIIPQVGHGTCDNALIHVDNGFVDIVTVPAIGYATVVRLRGGPEPGHPRHVGHQHWRHLVPTRIAVDWALTNPVDDNALVTWDLRS
jgi:hypothetical protein